MNTLVPVWEVLYKGHSLTEEIQKHARSVRYVDHAHGRSDEIEIEIADPTGKWRGEWYPAKGDEVEVTFGYEGAMVPAGVFRVDEVEYRWSPDVILIKGLAAAITDSLRTKRNHAYENMTLKDLAGQVAARHGLALVGEVKDIFIERVTQNDETDLAFLTRVAEEYGYAFSVRGNHLTFHDVDDLEKNAPEVVLSRQDLSGGSLKDKARKVYKGIEVEYQDPVTEELFKIHVPADDIHSGDILKRRVRADDSAQAETKARAILTRANNQRLSGRFSMPGNPRILGGLVIRLSGMGRLDGRYLIKTSTHARDGNGGYKTEAEVRLVP